MLSVLSYRQALIITLRFRDGMKVREVAARTGISPRTIKRETAQGIKILRAVDFEIEWARFRDN